MIIPTCSKYEPEPQIDDFQDIFENAPCGYVTLHTNGRIARVNKTLLGWTGHRADDMVGNRLTDFFNMAGRIYYATHIAPLLRMQGFFNEFAVEMVAASGAPVQMICNALEGRDNSGKALFTRVALLKTTDRRRYEQELLAAREAAKMSLANERETSEFVSNLLPCLATIFAILSRRSVLGRAYLGERRRRKSSIKS